MEDKINKISKNENEIKEIEEKINEIFHNYYGIEDEEWDLEREFHNLNNDPEFIANNLENEKKKLLIENRRLRSEIEQEQFDKQFEILSKSFKSGLMASDNESYKDTLSRELYAKVIIRHIVRKDVETPINIGVFGDWGEGKSSFLNLMIKEIGYLNSKRFEHISFTHVVRYDASEYDEINKIWASILSALFKEFESKRSFWGKIQYAYYNFIQSFKQNILKYLINGTILVLSILWLWFISKPENTFIDIRENIITMVGIIPLILFITNIFIPFIKQQLEFLKPLSSRVFSLMKTPDYKKELGARENIKSNLNDLLNVWTRGKNERIVIFIDELDRCSEKTISEFFNALQLLLSVKGITVVLSVNYKTVCYALANNNKHYFEREITRDEKIQFGVDYLKKYINIPIHLPQTRNYEEYIMDIIDKVNNDKDEPMREKKSKGGQDTLTKKGTKVFEQKEVYVIKYILDWINKQEYLTPREVKNIINILVILKEIIIIKNNKTNNKKEKIENLKFIKWFFYQYFNRLTASKLAIELINSKEEYNTIKETLDEQKLDHVYNENEKMAKSMIDFIKDIRVQELVLFKEVSDWFIKIDNY
ncbi:P-loop NTPase fold protein [Evansella sp. AB-rgal1]|uniref:KAP family P-loop NTPase fold protein n=1 Tax=Evansella sp. AB-rgal1 TaxID=3242696 RepID=UPI00359CD3CB